MERRALGSTGLEVGRLGLGCVTFGREIDERASFAVMDHAFENGVNLLDTAEAYGAGESERILGRWLEERRRRGNVVLQTKVKPPFTRDNVRSSLENSLKRLGVDTVDIYLFHQPDPTTTIETAMEAMNAVVESGLARIAGCSNFSAFELEQSRRCSSKYGFCELQVIQPPYSLVAREIESGLLDVCRGHGIGVVTYSPLAAGFLSGKYTPAGPILEGSRFDVAPGHADIYFRDRNFELVDKLRKMSARTGVSMTGLALGWVFRNPAVDCVLAGARTVEHVSTALAACSSNLEAAWIEEMDEWSQPCEAN